MKEADRDVFLLGGENLKHFDQALLGGKIRGLPRGHLEWKSDGRCCGADEDGVFLC